MTPILTSFSSDSTVYLSGPVADPIDPDVECDSGDLDDVERLPYRGRRRRPLRGRLR